jgi:hypothetical protein
MKPKTIRAALVAAGNTFVAVPKAEVLADQERIQQAVGYALGPFFKGER